MPDPPPRQQLRIDSSCWPHARSWTLAWGFQGSPVESRPHIVFFPPADSIRNSHTGNKFCCDGGGYSMRKALSLVLIAVFLVSLFGGLSVVPSAKAVAQEVTYNLGTEPATLDPGITATLADVNIDLQVFDGLTRLDSKSVPQPAIAKSWTISPRTGRRTCLRFAMRPGRTERPSQRMTSSMRGSARSARSWLCLLYTSDAADDLLC